MGWRMQDTHHNNDWQNNHQSRQQNPRSWNEDRNSNRQSQNYSDRDYEKSNRYQSESTMGSMNQADGVRDSYGDSFNYSNQSNQDYDRSGRSGRSSRQWRESGDQDQAMSHSPLRDRHQDSYFSSQATGAQNFDRGENERGRSSGESYYPSYHGMNTHSGSTASYRPGHSQGQSQGQEYGRSSYYSQDRNQRYGQPNQSYQSGYGRNNRWDLDHDDVSMGSGYGGSLSSSYGYESQGSRWDDDYPLRSGHSSRQRSEFDDGRYQQNMRGSTYNGGHENRTSQEGQRSFGQGEYAASSTSSAYGSSRHSGKGPKNYQRSDERITEEVNDCLTWDDDIDASDIDVKVESGVVHLSGTVEDRRTKRRAEEIIENLQGVKDVENNIQVQKSEQSSNQSQRDHKNKDKDKDKDDKDKDRSSSGSGSHKMAQSSMQSSMGSSQGQQKGSSSSSSGSGGSSSQTSSMKHDKSGHA